MLQKKKAHQIYKLKDGTVVKGVTTILENLGWNKQVLIAWSRKTALAGIDPTKVKEEAADILCQSFTPPCNRTIGESFPASTW